MPELRQNRFTKEWVIIATERARRPEELKIKRDAAPLPTYSEKCPFCPGNESMAPPAKTQSMDPANPTEWRIRVVANKFAAVAAEGEPTRTIHRSQRTMNAVGHHDVIVEGRNHALTTAQLPNEHVADIIRTYRQRYRETSADPRVAHVTIFKNHGGGAGASLEHPHSQLIATPVISYQVQNRLNESMRHHHEFGECIFCEVMQEEIADSKRTVMKTDHFYACAPFASASPFTLQVLPRRHMASFGDINDAEIADLGHVMRTLLGKLFHGLENPDFNYTIRSAPHENAGVRYHHWYISIIPRLSKMAGFELGSGMFINTVVPEAAAEFLRNQNADGAKGAAG